MVSNIILPSTEACQFPAEHECPSGNSASSETSSGDELRDVVLAPPDSGPNGYQQSTVSLTEFSRVLRHPTTGDLTSFGSRYHFRVWASSGSCKPCQWLQ